MNENTGLIVQNAKDIQNLRDACVWQNEFNKGVNRSLTCYGIAGMLICGLTYLMACAFEDLSKRVKTIEGRYSEKNGD